MASSYKTVHCYTSFNPQNLRNIIKKVAKIIALLILLLSNLSVKATVFCYFFDIPQILQV